MTSPSSATPQPSALSSASVASAANSLYDRIWFTRSARIQSEKRLLRNEHHSQLLLILYTIYSIALSAILMKFKPITDDQGAVFGLILSVALFGLSFHLTARGFMARAQRFRECYTQLQGLLDRITVARCYVDERRLLETVEAVQVEYQSLLAVCENHATIDDRRARFANNGLTSRIPTAWENIYVSLHAIGRHVFLALLYLSPIVVMIYLMCVKK